MDPTTTRKADVGFLDYLGSLGTAVASAFNDPVKAIVGPPQPGVKVHHKQS